jgi:two-component system LytT family response regulator
MTILIIEDEQPAARRLQSLIHEIGVELTQSHYHVIGVCSSVKSAVDFLHHTTPDIILSDIQLSDGLSFEIFAQTDCRVPIIFITAYDEYALKAFTLNSIDYLLKPIDKKDLQKSLVKYESLREAISRSPSMNDTESLQNLFKHILEKKNYRQRFLVETRGNLIAIPVDMAAYMYSEHKITRLVRSDGQEFFTDITLEQCEKELDPHLFFRLNRQVIAQFPAIGTIRTHFTGRLYIALRPPFHEEIAISREKAKEFKIWLNR